MKQLNKRSDIMDNSVEAYACSCAITCSCTNESCRNSCSCAYDLSQVASQLNSASMGIQGNQYSVNYTAVFNAISKA